MSLIDKLNEPQKQAVTTTAGPVLVLAGPGSGKTRVLTHRIAWLVQELRVEPYRILAVTFTNKAAEVMRERTEELLAGGGNLGGSLSGMMLGTFHRICARLLRIQAERIGLNPRYVIFDSDDQLEVVKQALRDLNIDEKRNSPRALHAAISRAKNELITPADYPTPTYREEIVARVYERYQHLLGVSSAVDFDDLLMKTVFMLRDHADICQHYQRRFEYVLVDEFQDTNSAQYEMVQLLSGHHRNVFVVGDEDQSIYRWRGADFRNVERFRKDYGDATVILLEQNYRSTQTILDAANAVIQRNRHRTPKQLFTDRGTGAAITVHQAYDEHDEGNFIIDEISRLKTARQAKPGECAIMYRTNAQSRALEEAFVRRGMPYRLVGATRFYGRKEVKDVMAYVRLIHNPNDDISLRRIINVPPRRIGETTVERLSRWATSLDISVYQAMQILGRDADPALIERAGNHPLTKATIAPLLEFYAMLRDWIDLRAAISPGQLLDRVLESSGYREWLQDGTSEGEDRWQNVQELRTVASVYEEMPVDLALDAFLEEVALVSDVDNLEAGAEAPVLLTLHAAKGLEFGIVFMTGVEEGLLPHSNSFEDPDALEEERRLAYVGITRAENRLYLLHTFRRGTWGRSDVAQPSRFLGDVPRSLIGGNADLRTAHRQMTTWGNDRRPGATLAPSGQLRYSPGQRVSHPKFGEGTVITSRLTGDDEEVSIAFPNAGIKRLLASLANLKVVK
ncbi:MAG: UvrD-helicase domain-containing protein [Caldilineales bacterium]|nr:UvrD-helicase domain-containing protein [Caldilineales bacterium]MCW5857899.1 UvrD-helicase domain-containing protein [Caldilineales bacterium]